MKTNHLRRLNYNLTADDSAANAPTLKKPPVLGVVCPDSGAHGRPDDDQQLPQPYRGEHGPVVPLNDPIQPQRQQHGEEQQTGVDQELTATGGRETMGQSIRSILISYLTIWSNYGQIILFFKLKNNAK